MKPLKHFTNPYLLSPLHPVTICLVGVGGTGSQVLTQLARMDHALRGLGHPGFQVTVWDGDTVSEANIGRQLFSEAEIGQHKATLLVSRVNRFFGKRWVAKPTYLSKETFDFTRDTANVLITCVDTIKARLEVGKAFCHNYAKRKPHPYLEQMYWLDFGNTKNAGQVVLGTINEAEQPEGDTFTVCPRLRTIFQLYPELATQEEPADEPSCSVLEALSRQDLMVNTLVANWGMDMFYRLFREGSLTHQGVFVNLTEVFTTKIPLPANYASSPITTDHAGTDSEKEPVLAALLA